MIVSIDNNFKSCFKIYFFSIFCLQIEFLFNTGSFTTFCQLREASLTLFHQNKMINCLKKKRGKVDFFMLK